MSVNFSEISLEDIYGEYCFSESLMKQRLPKMIFNEFKRVQAGEKELSRDVAEVIAGAMKDWAIEKGATHYTHWFQPLTGLTAEKHDSFISPAPDGTVLMEFSGKELIKGEPDASSFPSGGLRSTFEARGYTAWDTTSPAFLKQDRSGLTLTIPTAFVSYTGEALDKKTPLLRSMQAVTKAAEGVLHLMGDDESKKVTVSVGPEQEYFLIDKEYYQNRPDLRLTGRTIFGTMSAKGQELDDHYFGAIKDRVAHFMKDLNTELWRLGISAKTQHNEVAPNQFELATIYSEVNVATDRNQLVMEMMKKVADRHEMVCLLHEKPFAGVNGSGKHNNWSIDNQKGSLLKPGDTPHENARFLLFLTAIIKAVDLYAPLIRMSAANAGNDHRLGANEAPPAIISMYLGEQITEVLEKLSSNQEVKAKEGSRLEIGVTTLPKLPLDVADRNRTSPFAFTENKFEFRMVGSSQSIAGPNVVLNTVVAEILTEIAERLEKTDDTDKEISRIVSEYYLAHKRVIFNGNGYSADWVKEAEKRGLPNLKSTVEALKELIKEENIQLFEKHNVFNRNELESRYAIYLENYSKEINIEAGVAVEMARRLIYPAVFRYASELQVFLKEARHFAGDETMMEQEKLLKALYSNMEGLAKTATHLEREIQNSLALEDNLSAQAESYMGKVIPALQELRICADMLEKLTDKQCWPYPSYEDLLFNL
jgi:glutamine synthetase